VGNSLPEVYEAYWQQMPVLVKRLKTEYVIDLPEIQAQFKREATLLASLNHPNIIRTYGICEDTDYVFWRVQEFSSVWAHLDDQLHPPLPWIKRQNIALDIARGLNCLHQQQIVHGDLRACNIVVDKYYRAKIEDFGLAKQRLRIACSRTGTNDCLWVGDSKHWQPPELQSIDEMTTASDVYSFGMLLWEIVSGKGPFPFESQEDAKELLKDGQLWKEPYHAIPKDAPLILVELMKACCHLEAEKRPTMAEAVESLLAFYKTSAYSMCARDMFFTFKSGYEETGSRIAEYLGSSDQRAMACVNKGFNSFFGRPSIENVVNEEDEYTQPLCYSESSSDTEEEKQSEIPKNNLRQNK
jgi:serine/threonine protein kinase